MTKGHRSRIGFGLQVVICGILLYLLASSIRCLASRTWIDGTRDLIARANRVVDAGGRDSLAPGRVHADQQPPQVGDRKKFYAVDFTRSGSPYDKNDRRVSYRNLSGEPGGRHISGIIQTREKGDLAGDLPE